MTVETNKNAVIRFNKEVIEGKRTELMEELFSPDFVNRTVRPGFSPGPEGMLQFLQDVLWKAFSDIRVEIHDQVAEADKVTTRKSIYGTHTGSFMGIPASDKTVEFKVIDIVWLANGQYLEHWNVMDLHSVLAQIKE